MKDGELSPTIAAEAAYPDLNNRLGQSRLQKQVLKPRSKQGEGYEQRSDDRLSATGQPSNLGVGAGLRCMWGPTSGWNPPWDGW